MPEEDPTISIDEAFALATADEPGVVTPAVAEPAQPAVTLDPVGTDEQPLTEGAAAGQSESKNEIDSLIALATPEGGEPGVEPGSDAFWAQTASVTIDGVPTEMSLGDMRDGTMMRADYTKKTQDVARDRKMAEEAVEFYAWFRKDPTQASLYLAQKAGVVGADAQSASTAFDFGSTDEDAIAEKLEAAVAADPRVVQASEALELGAVNQTFTEIERAYGEALSPENKQTILRVAKQSGTTDLGLVFDALLMRGSQLRQAQAEVAAVGTTQSGGTPTGGDPNAAPEINNIDDAFDFAIRAMAEPVTA